jgi:hypothetical protein
LLQKVKPGQNIRKKLKARTEALEQAAELQAGAMSALQEEAEEPAATQPTFEEIMNMAANMDEVIACLLPWGRS